jgi:uncharacterized protein
MTHWIFCAFQPLLNTEDVNYDLLLPILVHCVDGQGRPLLGPTRKGPVVEALRQYWRPTRFPQDP